MTSCAGATAREGKEDLPDDVLDRTPSVRERDELTLPSYRVLDEIVERIIEGAEGVEEIVAAGFDRRRSRTCCG